MHRTIEMSVPAPATGRLLADLQDLDTVVGISVQRAASVRPHGDVVTVHVLNRGADAVMELARAAGRSGSTSVVTAELSAIADRDRQHLIDVDVDEALWEESETGLRHQGRITVNFLALMALGGALAVVGLVSEPVPQVIALVAASVIAPGFEPVAKVGLGLALRRGQVVKRGAVSALAGYGVLVLAAALTFALLRLLGETTPEALVTNPEVQRITHASGKDVITSVCAAAAGMVMVTAYRRSVLAGPLIALLLIPAAAAIGAAAVSGRWTVAAGATGRLGLDVLLVIGIGALVVAAKKATIHRRDPLI